MINQFALWRWLIVFWKGEKRDNQTFLALLVGLVVPSTFSLAYFFKLVSFKTENLIILLSINLFSLFVAFSILTWFVVGTVRSTLTQHAQTKYKINQFSRPSIKRVILVILVFFASKPIAYLALDSLNLVTSIYQNSIQESLASVELQSRDVILLSGPQGQALFRATAKVLQQNRGIRLALLDSTGGNVYWAKKTADLIRKHALSTHVNDQCLSSCTLLLLAGKTRTVSFYADIGFHIASNATPWIKSNSTSIQKHLLTKGISREFVTRLELYQGENMLYLTFDELLAEGFVDSIEMPHLFFDHDKYGISQLSKIAFPRSDVGERFLRLLRPDQLRQMELLITESAPLSVEQKLSEFVKILFFSVDSTVDLNPDLISTRYYLSMRKLPYSFTDLYGPLCTLYGSSKVVPSIFFDEEHNQKLTSALSITLSEIESSRLGINLTANQAYQSKNPCQPSEHNL